MPDDSNTVSVLRAENRRMKKQILALRQSVNYWEAKMGGIIMAAENKNKKPAQPKPVKCPNCGEGEVKSCQMHQKLYHRCQNCKKTWSSVPSASRNSRRDTSS